MKMKYFQGMSFFTDIMETKNKDDVMKNFLEKYFLQQKQPEINKLADEIYNKAVELSESLALLNPVDYSGNNRLLANKELDRLLLLSKHGDKNADYILEASDWLSENGEIKIYSNFISGIAPKSVWVKCLILDYETDTTGGFDKQDLCIRIYFSLPQFKSKKNNYNINRLKQTIMHEFTHASDYMNNNYYNSKASRSVIPSLLPEKDLKLLNSISPYVYDVLYRLWNDSEINAQQITITNELITAIEKGIYSLKQTDCNNEVFSVLKQVIPSSREKISNERFKRWFIDNSNKRLKKLINKKTKNDYLLNNQQK